MDSIEKILANLKKGELSFILTVLINALQIYLVCFYFIESFKSFQWYQEILIALSVSLSYTFIFIGCFLVSNVLILGWYEDSRKNIDIYFDSNLVFYFSISPLAISIIFQLCKFMYIDNFSFSLKMYSNIVCCTALGFITSPLFTLAKYLYKKYFK